MIDPKDITAVTRGAPQLDDAIPLRRPLEARFPGSDPGGSLFLGLEVSWILD